MKKLMIAAAAAAMVGGAFADAVVYDITIKGKMATTARGTVKIYGEYDTGKLDKNDDPIYKTGWYSYSDVDGKAVKLCYRKKGSFSWKGVLAGCECDEDTAVGGFNGFAQPTQIAAIWDTKKKAEVKAAFDSATFIRSGAKTDFVEAEIDLIVSEDYNLFLAGQGTFDAKAGYLKSISGNFVGALPINGVYVDGVDADCTVCDKEDGEEGAYCLPYDITLCDDGSGVSENYSDDDKEYATIAFGTWSMKYNSSKSKKMLKLNPVEGVFTAESIAKALSLPKYVKTVDFPAL